MGGDQSCSVKCGTVGGAVTQLMSYNGMYSLTNMEGNWHQRIWAEHTQKQRKSETAENLTSEKIKKKVV